MKKPLIGISGNTLRDNSGAYVDLIRSYVNQDYVRSIEEAGGIPIIIPFTENLEQAKETNPISLMVYSLQVVMMCIRSIMAKNHCEALAMCSLSAINSTSPYWQQRRREIFLYSPSAVAAKS